MSLNEEQQKRYSRMLALPEMGQAGQEALCEARVLVIGAGGLGAPALLYLAAGGVGHIGVIEHDRVALSNLHRQVLYDMASVGHKKTEEVKKRLLGINNSLRLEIKDIRLTEENARSLIEPYDIVLDGSDNFSTRFAVHSACYALRIPLVSAAVIGWQGQLSTFKGYQGEGQPCYRCFCPEAPGDERETCATGGVMGPVAGVIATLAATEVMKEIAGIGNLSGVLLRYHGMKAELKRVRLPKDPSCPECSKRG